MQEFFLAECFLAEKRFVVLSATDVADRTPKRFLEFGQVPSQAKIDFRPEVSILRLAVRLTDRGTSISMSI